MNGYLDDQAPDGKGSKRITNYDIKFANYLNHILSGKLPSVINLNDYSPVDWQSQNPEKYNVWAFEGVSPVFRYMEYTQGSEHFPHYDAPFISKENPLVRTLMSGVLYLTTNKSGATGFIIDGQNGFLCEAGNADELTQIIMKINALGPNQRAEISRNAIQTVSKMTDYLVAQNYINELEKNHNYGTTSDY